MIYTFSGLKKKEINKNELRNSKPFYLPESMTAKIQKLQC